MSANDKFGLGYEDHRYDGILSYENEVLQSVFMGKESDFENPPLYDRFVTTGGMHAVPPPMIGNYMPYGPDIEIDYSKFTYGPKQNQPSESETQTTLTLIPVTLNIVTEPLNLCLNSCNESNEKYNLSLVCCSSSLRSIESDSKDEYVSLPTKEQETPSFANQQVKSPRETVKNHFTHSKNPKVDKKELGYRFTARACFVCGSLNHLIRDCDFHEKRMAKQAVIFSAVGGKWETVLSIRGCNWRHKDTLLAKWSPNNWDYPHRALQNKGIVDSGCSRHMTGNKAYLAEYQDFNGGPVAFGGSKGYITGKETSSVYVSECLVLSPEFKLPNENQVLLRIPRQNNMYSFNLENIVPSGGLACLIAKATIDESNKWHRRLGHVNFKNLNKLVKENLVRGLPSKIFQNDHTCVACQKGKQHKASCKAKSVSSISHSLQLLHMDLFGPTSVLKIHTDNNVADLLTKEFDVSRFQFLVCAEALLTIGDEFQEVHWVFKSPWEEIKTVLKFAKHINPSLLPQFLCLKYTLKYSLPYKPLSLSQPTITNLFTMAVLESCPKHNMVAYLEKSEGSVEFHKVIDFLTRSSIYHALTVSPVVSTTFVEQFWMSAKSKIINNVRYITAKVAGKPVSISEASIRSDLLFDDADGIYSLPNQAIFDAIQLMGYEGDLTGKSHLLFTSMLVQSTEDEGATSERPSEPQPTPSPPHPSEANVEPQSDPSPRPSPTPHIPDSILEVSGGNQGGQSSSDRPFQDLRVA
ncbi:ribonuclease H-like domain-containing protein [Tanacetum coccineum]|uniref:Ribonuclease H-like domain-containing protein n=1 Tax=Tanacetum coccineum TaxID=301880 RepID=A0ABQ5HT10_9ASTR